MVSGDNHHMIIDLGDEEELETSRLLILSDTFSVAGLLSGYIPCS